MSKTAMMKMLGILILALAVLSAVVLVKTRPKAQRKKMSSMVPVVEVQDVETSTRPVKVQCMGTVIADAAVALQAEVTGRIIRIHPDLVEGAFVRKGEILAEIDPYDYELAVKSAEAALKKAQSSLRLEEGQQAVAKHEMELIGKDVPVDPAYRDLMLREPQLLSAQAAVSDAEAKLSSAQVDLERTKIRAPFDAVVQARNISEGDTAQTGKTLFELVATDRLFVRTSIPVGDLKIFPNLGIYDAKGVKTAYAAQVTAADGAQWNGTICKLLPDLSEQGRMARLLVAVNDWFSSGATRPMLLGEVMRVELSGREAENVCLIDRKYLRDGPTVWMIDAENKLHICPAEVLQGYADRVLVRFEFSKGWKLITSNMAAPVDGMQLKTVQDENGGGE